MIQSVALLKECSTKQGEDVHVASVELKRKEREHKRREDDPVEPVCVEPKQMSVESTKINSTSQCPCTDFRTKLVSSSRVQSMTSFSPSLRVPLWLWLVWLSATPVSSLPISFSSDIMSVVGEKASRGYESKKEKKDCVFVSNQAQRPNKAHSAGTAQGEQQQGNSPPLNITTRPGREQPASGPLRSCARSVLPSRCPPGQACHHGGPHPIAGGWWHAGPK